MAGVDPGGEHFRILAVIVADTRIERGGGADAEGGFFFQRGGRDDLGNSAVVLLGGGSDEVVKQGVEFGDEGGGQAGGDEGTLNLGGGGDDGASARDEFGIAAGCGESEGGANAGVFGIEGAGGAVYLFKEVSQVARAGFAQVDAAGGFAVARGLVLCGCFEAADDGEDFGVRGGGARKRRSDGMVQEETCDAFQHVPDAGDF